MREKGNSGWHTGSGAAVMQSAPPTSFVVRVLYRSSMEVMKDSVIMILVVGIRIPTVGPEGKGNINTPVPCVCVCVCVCVQVVCVSLDCLPLGVEETGREFL